MPEINIKLVIDGKDLDARMTLSKEQIRQLRGESESFSDSVSKWSMIVTGFNQALEVAQKIYAVISKPIDAAAQFEQYETSLKVMLGSTDAAKQRLSELVDFAKSTPFELPQVVEAANQLQAIGKYSEENLRMLGDLSSASGKPMEQALSAYAKMMTGQKGIAIDMFRDLLISADDWAKATGKKIGKNGELQASVEEMAAALPKIIKEKGFSGMMDAQSQTLKGMTSNFSDAIGQIETAIGEKLLPDAKKVVGAMTELASSLIPVKTHEDQARDSAVSLQSRFDELSFAVVRLGSKTQLTKAEQNHYKESLDALEKEYPNYFKGIDLHKTKYEELTKSINNAKTSLDQYIDSLITEAILQDKNKEIIESGKKIDKATEDKLEAERKYNEARKKGTLNEIIDQPLGEETVGPLTTLGVALRNQRIIAEKTISEEEKKIEGLREKVDNLLQKLKKGLAPKDPINPNPTPTSGTNSSDDTFLKSKQNELAEIEKYNTKILNTQKIQNLDYIALLQERSKEEENLRSIELKIKESKNKEQLESLKRARDISIEKLALLEDEQKKQESVINKEVDSQLKSNNDLQNKKSEIFRQDNEQYQAEISQAKAKTSTISQLENMIIDEKQNLSNINGQISNAKTQQELEELKSQKNISEQKIQLYKDEKQAKLDTVQSAIEAGYAQYDASKKLSDQLKELIRDQIKAEIAKAVMSYVASIIGSTGPLALFLAPAAGMAMSALLESIIPKFATGGLPFPGRIIRVDEKGPEFIVNAEATKKNLPLLQMINSGQLPSTGDILMDIYQTKMAVDNSILRSRLQSSGSDRALIEEMKSLRGDVNKVLNNPTYLKLHIGDRDCGDINDRADKILMKES